ncbi:MAG: ABC transporter ATP-binding protein [Anaerolineaceae bacterium]|nr:ABC transporter ATP-binding protein [Anaerolineaceae bacterium]
MSSEFLTQTPYNTNHSSPFRFILSHVRRHPWVGLGLIIGAFSNAALAAAVPGFIGQSVNAIEQRQDIGYVLLMVVGIVLSQALRAVLQLMRNYSSEIFAQRFERDVRDELYASLLGKSMSYHDFQPVGEIMARVTNDVREMNLMMNPGMNVLIGSSFFLLMPVVSAPLIHPDLLLVPVLFLVTHLTIQIRFIRRLHPIAQEVRASFGRMNARLAEALDGLQIVKGAAQEKRESELFNELADTVRDRYIEQGSIEARYLSNLLLPLAIVLSYLHAITLYEQGKINSGDVVTYVTVMFLFGFPVFSTLFSLPRIALGYASAGRILNVINAQTDLDQNESGHEAPITGEITFEHVDFGYGSGTPVLHDITFTIQPGQTVALVGQTGSGKSTVTKLINRIYDTSSGRVLVDGVDVRDWKLESLRSQISIIEQDIFLFSRTVSQNIAFGEPDAPLELIEESARNAQAHEFVMSFPEGYETVIGQRGVTLSGGQRQRLAIARAFLKNPPILVLDDSTSAIDSATEDLIQQAIWKAAKGRTTILITHRLSQIRWADHIIVLRKGRVVAQGTHEDLLQSSEAYRRIFARYEPAATPEQATTNGAERD